MMGRPDSGRQGITALTLSWESCDFLPRLIESTLQWADRFYILDTGSTDGSREYLRERSSTDNRLKYFTIDTDHTTFNRGRCVNSILDKIDDDNVRSDWYAIIDCDEIFEDDFVEHSLPIIRNLPRIYTEVSFQRPTLWYSDSLARAHDFALRDPRRSRIQFERFRLIDKDWIHLLKAPNDPPRLVRITPLRDCGNEKSPNWRRVVLDLLRRRIRSLRKESKTRRVLCAFKNIFTEG